MPFTGSDGCSDPIMPDQEFGSQFIPGDCCEAPEGASYQKNDAMRMSAPTRAPPITAMMATPRAMALPVIVVHSPNDAVDDETEQDDHERTASM